jgi:hypothetical protein
MNESAKSYLSQLGTIAVAMQFSNRDYVNQGEKIQKWTLSGIFKALFLK